ncbi:uncharacterized protein [Venturia canescens]|uniref:uncharacterized protein n=1 Tax=Venturia canescens TaxID=32260 RepID=UPI001C9D3F78|nr:uncharacterized protein LOC122419561 [Venturia canescens]XP_043290165.1 uncharacterized protein LOC122419561 [Venturia canescens]XP_043290166.1 uncharacterized protein LOC122419561 [Venturia canescens]
MLRKPIRTYEKKRGNFPSHPASSMNTIFREEIPPVPANKKLTDELNSNTDASLDYDPFETTFDRLAKDIIEHPVPQDITPDDDYKDSSDDAVSTKSSLSNVSDDPLLKEPLSDLMAQSQGKRMKKLRNNKRQQLGPAKTNVSSGGVTKTVRPRVRAKQKTKFKDENMEPNIELFETQNNEETKEDVRKKRSFTKSNIVNDATTSVHVSIKPHKIPKHTKSFKRCFVNLERLDLPFDNSSNSHSQKNDQTKKICSDNNISGGSQDVDNSESSKNSQKRNIKLSKELAVLLSKELHADNQGSVDSVNFSIDTVKETHTKHLESSVESLLSEPLNYNEQSVDPSDFGEPSNLSELQESKEEERVTKVAKKKKLVVTDEALMINKKLVNSIHSGTTSETSEPKKKKRKRKMKVVKKPAAQSLKEDSTDKENSVDSISIQGTLDDYNSLEVGKNQGENKKENNSIVLLQPTSESIDSVDFDVSSENMESLGVRKSKRTKLFKKPVVSLSRLSVPKKVVSHFSSSTPIVPRMPAGKSSLRLSPIKSSLNEDSEEPSDWEARGSAPKSNVKMADSPLTKSASPLAITSNKGSNSVLGNRRPIILSATPDPDPSTVMFNDTEVSEAVALKSGSSSRIGLDSPSISFAMKHLVSDKTDESFCFSSNVSSRTSSVRNENSIRTSTNDPSMDCIDEQANTSKEPSLGDKSQDSDDDWTTISGSLNTSSDKSLSGTHKNFEQLSSGENSSCADMTEFIEANETPNGQTVSYDNESFTEVSQLSVAETTNTSEKMSHKDQQKDHRALQAVVLLPRLTRSKISKMQNPRNSLEEKVAGSMESSARVEKPENSVVSDSIADLTIVSEAPSEKSKPEPLNDLDESPFEMESLTIDYSSENETEKSLGRETPGENSNVSSRLSISNQELSVQSPTNASSKERNEDNSKELSREEEKTEALESKDRSGDEGVQKTSENNTSLNDEASMQPVVLLSRLNDSSRITRRRNKYCNWNLNLSAISEIKIENNPTEESVIEEVVSAPKVHNIREKLSQATTVSVRSENSQTLHEISHQTNESYNMSLALNHQDGSLKEDKVVYLKPSKSWARSLSILNHVHSQDDLEFLAVGKGKKWRQSVQNILEMQQQGLIQSCIKKNEDSKELPLFTGLRNSTAWIPGSSQPDTSRLFGISSPGRFIRRVSIRVVPDCKSFDHIKDTSFLEAYGINPVENKQTTTQRSSLIDKRINLDVIPKTLCSTKPRDVVLAQCGQKSSLPFEECYPQSFLENCRKIGEGVYGEVFLYSKDGEKNVIKIIPIEGDMIINSERQKKFDEILSEIVIAKELHNLRFANKSNTNCFVEVKKIRCVKGKYPKTLIDLWKTFDEEINSENDCPSIFEENQLYIVLELGHGGEDLEAYVFQNSTEACALFIQTALALAVAEETLEFEHRDLHWGNLLISRTDEPQIDFKLDNKPFSVSSKGVKVSVIDFTLSRMSYQGCSIFNDLSMDEDLFVAQGEYQFEIYRLMRYKLENNWQRFEPYTNILWLHYILDKMITAVRYRRKNTKVHKNGILELQLLKDKILDFDSAVDFVTNCDKVKRLQASRTSLSTVRSAT